MKRFCIDTVIIYNLGAPLFKTPKNINFMVSQGWSYLVINGFRDKEYHIRLIRGQGRTRDVFFI